MRSSLLDIREDPNSFLGTSGAGLSKFQFTSGKSHRLRLINSGAEGIQKFSIDNHTMTVFANDFVPVQPYETNIVTLGVRCREPCRDLGADHCGQIGQRTDVIVNGTGKPTDSFWMRSNISSCSLANQPDALAIIYYEDANHRSRPTSQAQSDTTDPCQNVSPCSRAGSLFCVHAH